MKKFYGKTVKKDKEKRGVMPKTNTFISILFLCVVFFTLVLLRKSLKEYNWGPVQNEKVSPHPYLGFVLPYDNKNSNALGFYGPLIDKNNETYKVGVFGGSVALNYFYYQRNDLKRAIEQSGVAEGKPVHIYSFASGGYKQPQQLFTLSYLYTLGYSLDLVINIDGFNEIAVAYAENLQNGISSYYPRIWNVYSRGFYDTDITPRIGRIESLKKVRIWLDSLPLNIGFIPKKVLNIWYNKEQSDLLKALRKKDADFQTTGPEKALREKNINPIDTIINTWENSSYQMDILARAHGAKYVEIIQPNQHIKGSKSLTPHEAELMSKKSIYSDAATKLYPFLLRRIPRLQEKGVTIVDATQAFVDVRETIYIDSCCHYIPKGYSYVTPYIVNSL